MKYEKLVDCKNIEIYNTQVITEIKGNLLVSSYGFRNKFRMTNYVFLLSYLLSFVTFSDFRGE